MRAAAPAAHYVIPRFSANEINLRERNYYFAFNFYRSDGRQSPVMDSIPQIIDRCKTGSMKDDLRGLP